jgi:hypothetical protein
MDFSTAHSPPFVVNIDGTRYEVPRFTLRDFKSWAARRAKETLDESLEQFPEPEQRARFMLYWSEPAFDVAAWRRICGPPLASCPRLETCLERRRAAEHDGPPSSTTPTRWRCGRWRAARWCGPGHRGTSERSGDGGKKDAL